MDKLRTKVQNVDWWEITYLIIYGAIFTYEFLGTTMFEIKWPPRFGYIFLAASALYTIAKFIWHNTYTKKEMILSAIILFAFIMPALLTEYRFLWWVGFLIVGAKDVEFKKILKVYLVISVTIMVLAFAASQYGIIEDLQYLYIEDEVFKTRHSYGIIYPTDYAAHLFYMVLAMVICFNDRFGLMGRVWLSLLVASYVYIVSDAKTTTVCLVGFAFLCVIERVFRLYISKFTAVIQCIPAVCAVGFLGVALFYDEKKAWMINLNQIVSSRLEISKSAFDLYQVKLFGQNIKEIGNGTSVEFRTDYFFLDDVYIRILLEYGLVLFVVTLLILALLSRRALEKRCFLIVVSIVAIAVHSIMEHHLLEVAYNPIIFALFAFLEDKKQGDRRQTCIEKIAKVG